MALGNLQQELVTARIELVKFADVRCLFFFERGNADLEGALSIIGPGKPGRVSRRPRHRQNY